MIEINGNWMESWDLFDSVWETCVFVSVREYWPWLAWKWWREGKTKQGTAPQRTAVAVLDYLTFSWFKQLSLEFVLGKFSLQSPVWYNKHIHKQHITSILCYIRELSNKQVTTTQKHSSLLDMQSKGPFICRGSWQNFPPEGADDVTYQGSHQN